MPVEKVLVDEIPLKIAGLGKMPAKIQKGR